MTLLQLRYFIEVAEIGNFTRAAEHVHTSQPTISRQIQMLEEELGYSLFHRNSKPLKLTKAGQVVYEGAKNAISQINNTLEMAEIASVGKTGLLSVAFQAGYFSEYIGFPLIQELKENWSTLQVQSNKLFSWEQVKGLKNGSIDIAIGLDFPHWKEAGLSVKRLQKVETVLVMSANHRLANKKCLDQNDLCGETFFFTEPNGYHVEEIFKDELCLDGVEQVEVSASEVAYFKVLSENGLTISNTHDPMLMNNPYYHYLPITTGHEDYYVCAYDPENTNPVLNLFLDLVDKYYEESEE